MKSGALIAGVGIPGCGKSTVLHSAAKHGGWRHLVEPQERAWPEAAKDHSLAGVFTALSWFRAERVANLYEADRARRAGDVVLVDSYYDRLMIFYLDAPGMEWLMAPDDAYRAVTRHLAQVDHAELPRADVVVFINVDFSNWERLILSRSRKLDIDRVYPRAFGFQEHLASAVSQLESTESVRVLRFDNQFGSIDEAGRQLYAAIAGALEQKGTADDVN